MVTPKRSPPTRAWAAMGYLVASYLFGAATWMFGLVITYYLWGGFAVFLGLFIIGVGVVPFGVIAAAMHGYWPTVGSLVVGVVMTFGARALSLFLANSADRRSQRIASEIV